MLKGLKFRFHGLELARMATILGKDGGFKSEGKREAKVIVSCVTVVIGKDKRERKWYSIGIRIGKGALLRRLQ